MMYMSLPPRFLPGPRLQGWTVSLLLHATLGSAAVLTMSDLTLLPLKEPFKWDVSIVYTVAGEPAAAQAAPSPVAAVPQTTPAPPAETQPPVVEAAPPTPRKVQAEPEPVRTVTAVERPVPPPTPVQEPAPPTPREEVARETVPPVQKTAHPHVAAKAVTQAEPPAAVGTAVQAVQPSDQPAQMASRMVSAAQGPKADYGWLAKSLWQRVAELKRYPHRARLNHWEGKVILRAVIRHDGHLADLVLHESSGYEELDEAAMELVREACPLHMAQPLGRAQVVVQVPITYALR